MAKKNLGKPRRELTRRQRSHWEQQKRRQLIILAIGIFIVVAAMGVAGAGWFTTQFRPLHQTVLKVNDTSFSMDYYLNMLRYYARNAPTNPSEFSSFMSFAAAQLPTTIQQSELMRQGAAALGVTVDDKAVNEEFKKRKLSRDYRDIVRTELLSKKLIDDYFDKEVPTTAEQVQVMAMFLETEAQAAEIRAKIEAGEDFASLAAQYSLDEYTQEQKGDLGWHPQGILPVFLGSSVVEDYAFGSAAGVLSQPRFDEAKMKKGGYWLIKVLERNEAQKQTHVQAILLGNAETAASVKARLDAGEDFTTLAKELSVYQGAAENGGDLGWVTAGQVSDDFDRFTAGLPLNTVSDPVRDNTAETEGGYWLIRVVAKETDRQIADADRSMLKDNAMRDWLTSLWADPANKVENLLDATKMQWAIARVTKELGKR
ncbi:MAG: peptidylprolyl isomerase [Chloroflexi bacterium]|nr:peptidylprolyl isomerase [Chloroflexota bacterium]